MKPVVDLTRDKPAVIAGAGPGGLTAAYELARRRIPVVVFEQDTQVGGLARTVSYGGFRFDIGGHRFFTKIPAVQALWRHMLGEDFLERPRLSRILYRRKFFNYPLKPLNVVRNLGLSTTLSVLASYAIVKLRPIRPEVSFADWVSNRFGRRLYEIFFKTYTEKIWGMPAERISAQWAAQRIKGLSLRTAALNMLGPANRVRSTIKTLIHEFEYPRLGPGMMWERFAERVHQHGGSLQLGARVVGIAHDGSRVDAVDVETRTGRTRVPAGWLISTMPISELVGILDPPAPDAVVSAARRLKYRDFLTVALIINRADVFPDNWIYIHDDSVRVGRIQNYKNWSPEMVPDDSCTCLGLEYFTNQNEDLWNMPDAELIALATRELSTLGLTPAGSVVDGTVVRMAKAYPVYEAGYLDALETVKQHLARFSNLQPIGRNGMHKYNNQDHSMLTALLAVDNILGASHDIWAVNADDEYHEQLRDQGDELTDHARTLAGTQPLVPREIGVEFRDRRRF